MDLGITDLGRYRPRFGLDDGLAHALRATPDVRLAAPDEDACTLAWEALGRLDGDDRPTELTLAVPGGPVEPRALAAHAAATGSVARDAAVVPLAADAQAGDVLRAGAAAGDGGVAVLVDLPPRRAATAAPADDLALAVRFGEPRIARLGALASHNQLAFDRWDTTGAPRAEIDARFVEETLVAVDGAAILADLLERGGRRAEDLAGVVVSCTIALKPARLAQRLGVAQAWQALPAEIAAGTRGAATLSLALDRLAASGPDTAVAILELGWGGGGALLVAGPEVARAVDAVDGAPTRRYDYRSWQVAAAEPDRSGPWTSPAKLRRETADLLGPTGTICADCDGISYPYQGTCELCGSLRVERRAVARTGTVVTQTVDHLFGAPAAVVQMVVVDLDGGGRFLGQAVQDAARPLAVGDRARLVLRRLHQAHGLPHYFWKVDLDER